MSVELGYIVLIAIPAILVFAYVHRILTEEQRKKDAYPKEPDKEAIEKRYGHVLREYERTPVNFDYIFEACFRNIYDENSFEEGQHFYITFRKDGVELPRHIKKTKGDTTTIILEHQFENLSVDGSAFTVTLTFNRKKHTLTVPFKNIEILADPSICFAIQRCKVG